MDGSPQDRLKSHRANHTDTTDEPNDNRARIRDLLDERVPAEESRQGARLVTSSRPYIGGGHHVAPTTWARIHQLAAKGDAFGRRLWHDERARMPKS